jgi:hypothetical protein
MLHDIERSIRLSHPRRLAQINYESALRAAATPTAGADPKMTTSAPEARQLCPWHKCHLDREILRQQTVAAMLQKHATAIKAE